MRAPDTRACSSDVCTREWVRYRGGGRTGVEVKEQERGVAGAKQRPRVRRTGLTGWTDGCPLPRLAATGKAPAPARRFSGRRARQGSMTLASDVQRPLLSGRQHSILILSFPRLSLFRMLCAAVIMQLITHTTPGRAISSFKQRLIGELFRQGQSILSFAARILAYIYIACISPSTTSPRESFNDTSNALTTQSFPSAMYLSRGKRKRQQCPSRRERYQVLRPDAAFHKVSPATSWCGCHSFRQNWSGWAPVGEGMPAELILSWAVLRQATSSVAARCASRGPQLSSTTPA